MERTETKIAFEKLSKVLPGGVNSPVRAFSALSAAPLVASRGCGSKITDVDGNEFIDYCMSWGALILGHAHPSITSKVKEQVDQGSSFGVSTLIESEIALEVQKIMPHMEKMRFVSSGTEATMSAIRLARGYTGRKKIIKFVGNYHGHSDFFMISAGSYMNLLENKPSTLGIPEESVQNTIVLPFNDVPSCAKFFNEYNNLNDIAAVIIEPVAGNIGVVPASNEFLELLRVKTQEIGSLLIFDEVMTGFRVGLKGCSGLYGINPDLTCLGKIVGGGFPAAAFGGKAEIMDCLAPTGQIFQAGTLSGNPVAMQAGLATLKEIQKPKFYEQLSSKMDRLLGCIYSYIKEKDLNMCIQRVGSMFTFFFGMKEIKTSHDLTKIDRDLFDRFFSYMLASGVYISPSCFEANFLSSAHTFADIDYTKEVILEFLKLNANDLVIN